MATNAAGVADPVLHDAPSEDSKGSLEKGANATASSPTKESHDLEGPEPVVTLKTWIVCVVGAQIATKDDQSLMLSYRSSPLAMVSLSGLFPSSQQSDQKSAQT